MSEPFVVRLHSDEALRPAPAGEKAAALARAQRAGLPVPPGFVITAAAFEAAIAPIAGEIESHLGRGSVAERAEDTANTIGALVLALQPERALKVAIDDALRDAFAEGAVAVRSSSTAEDLPGASFAGQYESHLNVRGVDAVLERMRAVWASLYSATAIAYRQHHHLPHAEARMAVLVQQQLDAEASGVLFTRDPVSGDRSRMVVNAAFGLGEGIVGGEGSVDTFALDAGSFGVLERNIATKRTMFGLDASGGLAERALPAERRDAPSLSDAQLARLGALAAEVRRLEGGDRDVEFAFAAGELYLLQARPVTGIDNAAVAPVEAADPATSEFPFSWDDPAEQDFHWLRVARTPLARLEQDVRLAFAPHLARVFEDTGIVMARNHITRIINGYPYARSPDVTVEDIEARVQRFTRSVEEFERGGASYYDGVIEPAVVAILDRLGPFRRPAGERITDRVSQLEAALAAAAHVFGDLHWRMAAAPSGQDAWPRLFHELTGEPEIDSGVLLQALDNRTTRLIRRLRAIARVAQSDAAVRGALEAGSIECLREPPLRDRPAACRFRARFSALLRDFGRRSGLSYGSAIGDDAVTWNVDPRAPLELIATYAGQDLDELERMEAAARREREAARRRIRRRLGSATRARFDVALRRARAGTRRMEDHNALMEQGVMGVMREAIWWVGRGLQRAGRIDAAEDVAHLSLAELRDEANAERDLQQLVAERRAELARQSRLDAPRSLGRGERPPMGPRPPGEGPHARRSGREGDILHGVAASRGRHTGRARVFPPDGARPAVERGDILVARNAGQDWTPILPLLGGIVLDRGAVFQHAALIAREYRVPAVVQTREGTSTIVDGQRITIDGDNGIVELAP